MDQLWCVRENSVVLTSVNPVRHILVPVVQSFRHYDYIDDGF